MKKKIEKLYNSISKLEQKAYKLVCEMDEKKKQKPERPEWIRVISHSDKKASWWYEDKINQIFKVKGKEEGYGYYVDYNNDPTYMIKFKDCQPATPPKQPIFQINGKDMFEGKEDEYWYIDKAENWVLEKYTIDRHPNWYKNGWGERRFTTKQEALNYVLEEAKKRFEKGYQYSSSNRYKNTGFEIFNDYAIVNSMDEVIWYERLGFTAEPIKQPKLMLGDQKARIVRIKYSSDYCIKCGQFQVTEKEWIKWIDIYDSILSYSGELRIKLGKYDTYFGNNIIIIGNIENVTIDQIEQITKTLNETK